MRDLTVRTSYSWLLVPLALLAACTDQVTDSSHKPGEGSEPPVSVPTPVGVYQIEVSGLGSGQLSSSLEPVAPATPGGINAALGVAGSGIVFEQVSSSSFTEGARGAGGQRYVSFTYRVRNGTGAPLPNVTMLLVSRTGTVPGTALSSLRRFDGGAADPAFATKVVPTGAVAMGSDLESMQALYPDVLQVLSEDEVAAIAKPGDVTNIFPVGYVVRNRTTPATRTLPVAATPNQYDGLLTLSFRVPLAASPSLDVFSFFFQVLAVTDTETRLTESMEEAADTAAVRRLRARAAELGATSVTVLPGSLATDAAVADYPGMRQLCSVRTAGTAAAPVTFINAPGPYTQLMLLRPGETRDACAAGFRGGNPGRPATNVPFPLLVSAMDRYGNLVTTAADTVSLVPGAGSPPSTPAPGGALTLGQRTINITYSNYGSSTLVAMGRRNQGAQPLTIAGVTRTWTGATGSTSWDVGGNWALGAVPMPLDSVVIPAAPAGGAVFPTLVQNVTVGGVTVEENATLNLGAFDLTATGSVQAGMTGGITNTVGRLALTGVAQTVAGRLPRLRVTGTYSLAGNVNTRAPLRVEAGRLRNGAFRVRVESF
ncbi:MAG TPA: hypothetical protein VF665_12645 [Longimicrobium sp.]|jgi:hypothetical protein|uniref:hypothetical protein n=1 Tax=Longimicrobium sp. TaxID=2029185 RepID=UPI002ED7E93D